MSILGSLSSEVNDSISESPRGIDSSSEDLRQQSSASTTPEREQPALKPVSLTSVEDVVVEGAGPLESIAGEALTASPRCITPTQVPADEDITMIDLVDSLDNVLQFQEQTASNPRYFDVPKGYAPRYGCLPGQFYQQKEQCRRVDKRKRETGVLDKNSKLKRHGFRPEELIQRGALDLEDCRPPSLDNQIHPIFDISRFDECPDHIYEQMEPALRLASKFLTEPVCCQFWVTLAKGARVLDEDLSSRLGREAFRIRRNVDLTEENVSSVVDLINSHGRRRLVHFVFRSRPNVGIDDTQLGTQHTICDYKVGLSEGPDGELCRSVITLHSDLYIAAAKFAKLKYPDVAQKLRFSFLLAVLLVHELCHAIHATHDPPKRQMHDHLFGSRYSASTMSIREPFVLGQTEAEVGASWERQMFGGKIDTINGRLDGQYGLSITDWPFPVMDSERRELFAIPMSYMEKLFQRETWEHKFNLKQLYFRIPRDGASSIYLNCYTTMSPDEEGRIKQEEAAEAEKESVEAEGSKKKRLLNTGQAVAIALPQDETAILPPAQVPPLNNSSDVHEKTDQPNHSKNGVTAPAFKAPSPEKKRAKSNRRRTVSTVAAVAKVPDSPIDVQVSRRQSTAVRA